MPTNLGFTVHLDYRFRAPAPHQKLSERIVLLSGWIGRMPPSVQIHVYKS